MPSTSYYYNLREHQNRGRNRGSSTEGLLPLLLLILWLPHSSRLYANQIHFRIYTLETSQQINCHFKFLMVNLAIVSPLLDPQDWFAALNQQNVYFHIFSSGPQEMLQILNRDAS